MNNSDILSLTFDLRDLLLNSELYKDLKNKEKMMMENEECSTLLYEFQKVQEEYKEAKRFEKYGSNVTYYQKKLSELKYNLDENQLVKNYTLAYKKMSLKLKEIENNIFKDIIKEKAKINIED